MPEFWSTLTVTCRVLYVLCCRSILVLDGTNLDLIEELSTCHHVLYFILLEVGTLIALLDAPIHCALAFLLLPTSR